MYQIKLYVVALIGIILLIVGLSHTALCKVYIDIDSPAFLKFPIAITNFKDLSGKKDGDNLPVWFSDSLAKKLEITGFFRMISKEAFLEDSNRSGITLDSIRFSDWVSIGAETLVKGGFKRNGEELSAEFRLFDVIQGKPLIGKKYWGRIMNQKGNGFQICQ
jgi:TolB amino-terminal domain.